MRSIPRLKRTLGLPLLTLYGLGNILGAGIYVLVGKVAGFAGYSITLSFMIAMFAAALTAFSYMELSGRYPVSASVSTYLHKAFRKRWLSVGIGLAMIVSGIASASALSQGFAEYLRVFFDIPAWTASVALLLVIGAIAIRGIKGSARTAALFTAIEVMGLLLVIWFGRDTLGTVTPGEIFHFDHTVGMSGIVAGAFLAFYAFIGFEDMVNVAEEVKSPRRTMPMAILLVLILSTILYLAVVIVAINAVPPDVLSGSKAPLALIFDHNGADGARLLSAIGVVAAVNGVIVQVIMGSRILYGLSKQGWIDSSLSKVHKKYNTPLPATLLIVGVMIVGTLLLPLVSLAQVTSLLVLSIFFLVNIALVVIKRRKTDHKAYAVVPVFLPYVAAAMCAAMIIYQIVIWVQG